VREIQEAVLPVARRGARAFLTVPRSVAGISRRCPLQSTPPTEMAKRHADAKAKGNHTGLIDPADIIAADAEGNNQTIEVQQGMQTLTFALKKKAKKN
jgi:hypothetical protein